jgi:hypothetical protein
MRARVVKYFDPVDDKDVLIVQRWTRWRLYGFHDWEAYMSFPMTDFARACECAARQSADPEPVEQLIAFKDGREEQTK